MSQQYDHHGRAVVPTERAQRYAKQLASHLSRKLTIDGEGEKYLIRFETGQCELECSADALTMSASAADPETLGRVQDVVGRHLEKFGVRDGLSVSWQAA